MAARTKRQRTSPDMSPVGDDLTDSSRIMSAMSDRFEDIVKKEIKKEISAMEDRLNPRLTRVEASLVQLVNQHHQTTPELHNFSMLVHQHFESRRVHNTAEVQWDYVGSLNVGGDGTIGKGVSEGDATFTEALDGGDGTVGKGVDERDATLTEANDGGDGNVGKRVGERDATLAEALDGGDGTIGKGDVGGNGSHGRGDNDQGGLGSTLGGGDGTYSEGIVGGDDTHSEGHQIMVQNILLQEGIVVQTPPPSEDDTSMVDYLAVKNEYEHYLKIRSRYMNSPYVDPFREPYMEKQKLKTNYSRFKRSLKDTTLNIGVDCYATKQFFLELESPTCWLYNEAKLCKEWKKFQPSEDALLTVGDPDGHWILCLIDLDKRNACIYDPLHRQKKIATCQKQITPLLRFIPAILQEFGYFQQKGIPPNRAMFSVQ
ncbi:hypothetical protein Dsin_001532 [Dipteronia sinensis]|uniref:Ubiquitin-like protease family profile domain-containing protein n=1 Tax=Dipteronia sinensis TaxID=43782 RepID=A0AAE0B4J8_9ROSI|nr:hypothetical protein Dsin_001532 [Dipteronia sinensis]